MTKTIKLRIKKIFLALLLFIFLIFIIEIFLRLNINNLVANEIVYRDDGIRVPYPYVMFKGLKNNFDHNEGGYRGIYPTKNKKDNEYRIFILGGSTVYEGAPSIAELLTEKFSKNGYNNVKAFNFGVVSAVSTQELITIVTEISKLEPDLIIQYSGANDIYHPFYYDPRPGYPFNFFLYESNPLLNTTKLPLLRLILHKSFIIRFLGERLFTNHYFNLYTSFDDLKKISNYSTDNWKKEIADTYITNIIEANKISKAFGANYIAFFQPTIYSKKYLSKNEKEIINKGEEKHFIDTSNLILNQYKNEKDMSNYFIDFSNLFGKYKTTIFRDYVHVHQEAQPIITDKIYEIIINKFF